MKPLVIAHRGAPEQAAENSLIAIETAVTMGADRIEVDVHRTRDDVIVVHHDDDLRRSAGIDRRIDQSEWAELRAIPLRYGQGPEVASAPMPTLEMALDRAHPVPLVVEIKPPRSGPDRLARRVVELLARHDPLHSIISFDPQVVRETLELWDPARVGLIRGMKQGRAGWRDALEGAAMLTVLSSRVASPAALLALHAQERRVWIYCLDDEQAIRHWLPHRPDGVISNRPDLARSVVDRAFAG